MVVPPRPAVFSAGLAPAGAECRFVTFADDRPPITPRALHLHTNAARGEGTVESAWRWSHAKPNSNTLPHYQLDRTHGGVTRCWKMLPTSQRGIGSTTVSQYSSSWSSLSSAVRTDISTHGNVRDWTIVVETADTGTDDDPAISPFDDGQVEMAATIIAYESIVHGFPIVIQPDWWAPGVASHTDPYGYPYTTLYRGKICPGDAKKKQLRQLIVPRAVQIRTAWLAPPDPPEEDDDMARRLFLARSAANQYELRRGDGNVATVLRSNEYNRAVALLRDGRGPEYVNPENGTTITAVAQIPSLSETDLDLLVGYPAYELTLPDEG